MAPCIEMYNKFVNAQAVNNWEQIQKLIPSFTPVIDYNKYDQLATYLSNIITKLPYATRFKIADNHEDIVSCMANWGLSDKPYNLFNIDHHHDCGYNGGFTTYEDVTKQDLGCGNWAIKMQDQFPLIKRYVWINNLNSNYNLADNIIKIFPEFISTNDINIINYIKFDYVFFCLSPAWVPPQCQPLFDTLTFLFEKIIKK